MRGRPRKNRKANDLAGNPGKRPDPAPPAAPSNAPEPFDWMTLDAKFEWNRLAPDLARRGLLSSLDLNGLACYCQALVTYRDAIATIEKDGEYYQSGGYIKKHPASGVRDLAAKEIAMWSRELGLVPTSRQRLGVTEPTEQESEIERFLREGK